MAEPGPSRLVVGTAAIGMPYGLPDPATGAPRRLDDAAAEGLVREAWACSLRVFDTAPAYGDAEARLGRALDGGGAVWTKLDSRVLTADDPAMATRASIDASLSRLRRPRIDLLQWHNWTAALGDDPRFRAIWRAVGEDGRCAGLGASTYGPDDALAAVESGFFAVVQLEWNLLNQVALAAAAPAARQRGVRLAARSVLLQGVLTGRGAALPAHLAGLAPHRARAAAVAERLGLDLATLALRAAAEHPDLDHVLVGIDAPGQAAGHRAAATTGVGLSWEELRALHVDGSLTDPRRWAAA